MVDKMVRVKYWMMRRDEVDDGQTNPVYFSAIPSSFYK